MRDNNDNVPSTNSSELPTNHSKYVPLKKLDSFLKKIFRSLMVVLRTIKFTFLEEGNTNWEMRNEIIFEWRRMLGVSLKKKAIKIFSADN